jgi:hypothetical protein
MLTLYKSKAKKKTKLLKLVHDFLMAAISVVVPKLYFFNPDLTFQRFSDPDLKKTL